MDKERLGPEISKPNLHLQNRIFRPAAAIGTVFTYQGLEVTYYAFRGNNPFGLEVGPLNIDNPIAIASVFITLGGFFFWLSIPPRVSE